MNVTFTDNSREVLEAFERAKKNALTAIGITAEQKAKKVITQENAVDTGRLRNSITWATKDNEGESFSYEDNNGNRYNDRIGTGADDESVYLGTNVEYAEGVETGSRRRAGAVHFLQRGSTESKQEFKRLTKEALDNA